MNVQTVSFMPSGNSMNIKENRAESEAFSKELERKIDVPKAMQTQGGSDRVKAQTGKDEVETESNSSVEKEPKNPETSKAESGDGRLVKKQTPKQERLKKFMDSLESEFQIPPTRIVEAFSQLSPQELSLPADQSIERVVENLDLSPNDAIKVKDLYGDLVQDLDQFDSRTSEASFNPAPSALTLGMEQTRARFDRAKSQRMAVQKSLDQMNQSFWQPQKMIKAPPSLPSEALIKPQMSGRDRTGIESYRDIALASSAMALPMEELAIPVDHDIVFDPEMGEPMVGNPDLQTQNQVEAPKAAVIASTTAMRLPGLENESDQATMMPMLENQYGINKPKEFSMPQKSSQLAGKLETLSAAPMDFSTSMLSKLNGNSNFSRGQSDFFSQGEKNSNMQSSEVKAAKASGDEMKALMASLGFSAEVKDSQSTIAPVQTAPITPEVADRNIQNVMQQAQYLVKNGGGEMKVKMTPEGLGEIQLHVELKSGRVQMHMLTENKETKKMLESGLSDLKESLSQQNIALDSVKIDSVVKTNVENQTHNQNHFQQHQNQDPREQRQFWNQFQEQFGGRPQREALFEPPKVKGYGPKKSETIAPAENSTGTHSSGKSSNLNLVA